MCLFNISILKLKDGFIPSLKVKVAWHSALANKALDMTLFHTSAVGPRERDYPALIDRYLQYSTD